VGITIFAQAIKLVLQITSISVLSRLLEPSDFGLVAMVTVFTGFALHFMEGGLSMATIQREQITHAQVSNLFWVNTGLGFGLGVMSIILAPLVAKVYEEPRLTLMMIAMSLTFIIGGFSVQHEAILKRQMRFRAISWIDVTSMAAGIGTAILAALNGLGYWSLIISPIFTFFVKTVLCWWSVRWIPSLMSRGSDVLPLLVFGANLTGANFVGYLVKNLTPFAVGYIGGAQTMGLYNRANTLTSIPSSQLLPPIMNVMQSSLTRVRYSSERFRNSVLSLMSKIAIVTMVVTVTMFITADWLILVLLGEGWESAVALFRILSLSTIVTPITTFTAIILIATGEAKALMKWRVITFCILLGSVFIGSYWGFFGVVLAHGLSGFFIRMPFFLVYSTKFNPIKIFDYVKALIPALSCATLTLVVLIWLRQLYTPTNPVCGIFVFSLLSISVYFPLCLAISSTRFQIMDGFRMAKILFDK
jgi:PST family polysaccharide transporter